LEYETEELKRQIAEEEAIIKNLKKPKEKERPVIS